ncbi:hypothetical protein Tco_0811062 [Tanacetum coccineum]
MCDVNVLILIIKLCINQVLTGIIDPIVLLIHSSDEVTNQIHVTWRLQAASYIFKNSSADRRRLDLNGHGNLNGENPFLYVCDRGNHRGGVWKETLCRLGLRVELIECVGKVPSNYHGSLCSLGMSVSSSECVDKAPYYPGFHGDHHDNYLLTKETKLEPIIWDIGDEEDEYPFVDNYPKFQEEENNVSFLGVVLGVEEESMPVYDTDIEDVIEEKEGFFGKG